MSKDPNKDWQYGTVAADAVHTTTDLLAHQGHVQEYLASVVVDLIRDVHATIEEEGADQLGPLELYIQVNGITRRSKDVTGIEVIVPTGYVVEDMAEPVTIPSGFDDWFAEFQARFAPAGIVIEIVRP